MTPTADCATRNNASPATGGLTYTQLPENLVEIARQQKWGQDALAKAQTLEVSSFKAAAMRWSDIKTMFIIKDRPDFRTNSSFRKLPHLASFAGTGLFVERGTIKF